MEYSVLRCLIFLDGEFVLYFIAFLVVATESILKCAAHHNHAIPLL